MLRLFREVPGIALYRAVGESCLVEIGYRHPLRLESCASLFEAGKLYLFSGARDRVEVVTAPPLVPAQDLVGGGFELDERAPPVAAPSRSPQKLEVPLKLVYSADARRRVTATLVPWAQADWLRRLVYLLPPTMLESLRVAAIAEGLFVVGEHGIDGLPVGALFQEAAPSIYVPTGFQFHPRVSPEVLTDHLGGVAARCLIFPPGGPPAALEHAAFEPLSRRTLAGLEVEARSRDPRLQPPRSPTPATVINEDAGVLPLWGFQKEPRR
jgi:hypothetical protein